MVEIERLAKRCTSCKHYYLSPCGDDAARLASCPNWSYVHGRVRTPRVLRKQTAKRVLPDNQELRIVKMGRVKRIERVKAKPKKGKR